MLLYWLIEISFLSFAPHTFPNSHANNVVREWEMQVPVMVTVVIRSGVKSEAKWSGIPLFPTINHNDWMALAWEVDPTLNPLRSDSH